MTASVAVGLQHDSTGEQSKHVTIGKDWMMTAQAFYRTVMRTTGDHRRWAKRATAAVFASRSLTIEESRKSWPAPRRSKISGGLARRRSGAVSSTARVLPSLKAEMGSRRVND
jgi:hypothetical protein